MHFRKVLAFPIATGANGPCGHMKLQFFLALPHTRAIFESHEPFQGTDGLPKPFYIMLLSLHACSTHWGQVILIKPKEKWRSLAAGEFRGVYYIISGMQIGRLCIPSVNTYKLSSSPEFKKSCEKALSPGYESNFIRCMSGGRWS